MALSDDQKAILRLLNQRGEQGYEDLSALMGIGVDEVHRRAKQAADQLEAEGIPAPAIPAPSGGAVGGGGSPSVAKDGEAPPGEPPPPTAPQEPQEPAPEMVHSSEAPRAKPSKSAAPEPRPERPRRTFKEDVQRLKLLENRGLWALLAGVAVVALFLVLIFTGGDDGDDGGGTTTTGSATQALEQAAAREGKEVTKAVLNPVDGSESSGEAVFGRVKNKLALQVLAKGLEETAEGESYTIWLRASADKMLPLASSPVGENGQIAAQVDVPVEVLAYLANETFGFIAITKTDNSQLEASLAQATKKRQAPLYTGTEVLRGEVTGPIVGAAERIEAEEKEGE